MVSHAATGIDRVFWLPGDAKMAEIEPKFRQIAQIPPEYSLIPSVNGKVLRDTNMSLSSLKLMPF